MAKRNSGTMMVLVFLLGLVLAACDNADSLKKKGDERLAAGDFEQAISFYNKAIENQPSPQLYMSRSEAYIIQENTATALEDLNAAINLDSGLIDAYIARAAVYFGMGDYKSARSDYNQALGIDPENQDAKQGTSSIDEIEDRAATNALKNTTWWGIPFISGIKIEQPDSFMWVILYFGEKTCKKEMKIGSYYYGPSYGPLYNGARLVMNSGAKEMGAFEVKRNKLLLGGKVSGELTGSVIRMTEKEQNLTVELKKGKPPHSIPMTAK
jgi:tetratricopeptide (TPR) repeat protein